MPENGARRREENIGRIREGLVRARELSLRTVGFGLMLATQGRPVEAVSVLVGNTETDDEVARVRSEEWLASLEGDVERLRALDAQGEGAAAGWMGLVQLMQADERGAREAWTRGEAAGDMLAALGMGALLLRDGRLDDAERSLDRAADRGSATGAALVAMIRAARGDESGGRVAMERADALGFQWNHQRNEPPSAGPRRAAAKLLRRGAAALRKAGS